MGQLRQLLTVDTGEAEALAGPRVRLVGLGRGASSSRSDYRENFLCRYPCEAGTGGALVCGVAGGDREGRIRTGLELRMPQRHGVHNCVYSSFQPEHPVSALSPSVGIELRASFPMDTGEGRQRHRWGGEPGGCS